MPWGSSFHHLLLLSDYLTLVHTIRMDIINKQDHQNTTSDFSIDHILNRAGQNTCISINNEKTVNIEPSPDTEKIQFPRFSRDNFAFRPFTFQWLNCTRYHPPKLQRVAKSGAIRRQPGRHPRIPFTLSQIDSLERSYKNSPYLCPGEVSKLSRELDLSDARIKIWFQNRRAREKREKELPSVSSSKNDNSNSSIQDFLDYNNSSSSD